jgi:hypothetical protein
MPSSSKGYVGAHLYQRDHVSMITRSLAPPSYSHMFSRASTAHFLFTRRSMGSGQFSATSTARFEPPSFLGTAVDMGYGMYAP